MHTTANIGALFKNKNQRSARSPHVTGTLELSRDLLAALVKKVSAGEPPRIQLAGWRNSAARTGETYITLKAQLPYQAERAATLPFLDEDDPLEL